MKCKTPDACLALFVCLAWALCNGRRAQFSTNIGRNIAKFVGKHCETALKRKSNVKLFYQYTSFMFVLSFWHIVFAD